MDSSAQGKNILLFSDGTGNSSGKLFKTNVWRAYEAVDLGINTTGDPVQIAYYDNGVGTSKFKPLAWLGGIFGFGLQRNVRALYQFACRNYGPGDRIYCFGFSRGAYTIRLVAALLATRGIVEYSSESELGMRTRDVVRDFQKDNEPNLIPYLARFNRAVLSMLIAIKRAVLNPHYVSKTKFGGKKIAFLGVWDTVSAYGGPSAEITRAIDNFIYPLSMTDQRLSTEVEIARHALSIDDERDAFHPLLWDEYDWRRKGPHPDDPTKQADFESRMQQVWFAGVHSDVGGGYPDESLSYVSLAWMMSEATKQGVRFLPEFETRIREMSNSLGPIHNSRNGLASYYRYQPRRIESFFHEAAIAKEVFEETRSYRDPVQGERLYPPKGFLLSCKVHQSVAARVRHGTDDYAPIVLPPEFEFVPFNFDSGSGGNPPVDARTLQALTEECAHWEQQREHLYNKVWWRRIAYFSTVLVTAALVLLPLYSQRFMRPSTTDGQWVFGRLTSWGKIIPGFLQPWMEAFQTSPLVFLGLLVLAIAGSTAGVILERTIRSRMRHLWNQRLSHDQFEEPNANWIEGLRLSRPYQRIVQGAKWYALPIIVGLMMLAAILYLVWAVGTQIYISKIDTKLCTRSGDGNPYTLPTETHRPAAFHAQNLCNATGIQVQEGQPYSVELAIPANGTGKKSRADWRDGSVEGDPNGIAARQIGIWGFIGAPLRRLVDARYMQVLYEIRPKDRDEHRHSVIVSRLNFTSVNKENPRCWIYRADFISKQPGELFLFANDAILWGNRNFFYQDQRYGNHGDARIYVQELHSLRSAPTESAARKRDPCMLAANRP